MIPRVRYCVVISVGLLGVTACVKPTFARIARFEEGPLALRYCVPYIGWSTEDLISQCGEPNAVVESAATYPGVCFIYETHSHAFDGARGARFVAVCLSRVRPTRGTTKKETPKPAAAAATIRVQIEGTDKHAAVPADQQVVEVIGLDSGPGMMPIDKQHTHPRPVSAECRECPTTCAEFKAACHGGSVPDCQRFAACLCQCKLDAGGCGETVDRLADCVARNKEEPKGAAGHEKEPQPTDAAEAE